MKIFINKEEKFDAKELFVIAVLNALYGVKNTYLIVTIEHIFYFAMGRFSEYKQDKTILNAIRAGFDSLIERSIIEVLDNKKEMYVLSDKGLTIDTGNHLFVVCAAWEMQKIFQNCNKPFQVFELFIQIIGTINNQTKEYHMSQDSMLLYFGRGGSKSTLNNYIKQLEDLELIYMYRPHRRRIDGTYRNINNVYGRYEDKEAIINSAFDYINKIDSIQCNTEIDRRSIKLRYNHFLKGSVKYKDINIVKELYEDCIKYNESLKVASISGGYGKDKEWKEVGEIDLSVFPEEVSRGEELGEYKDIDGIIDNMDIFTYESVECDSDIS